jgi:hypothetical protein
MGWKVESNERWIRYWPITIFIPFYNLLIVHSFVECYLTKKRARKILATQGALVGITGIRHALDGFRLTYDDEARELRRQLVILLDSKLPKLYKECLCPNCGQSVQIPVDEQCNNYNCLACNVPLYRTVYTFK